MPANSVCALSGCPRLVQSRPGHDTLFCSEMHLALFQLAEIRDLLTASLDADTRADFTPRLTLSDVSEPIPLRRSGTLDRGTDRTGKVW